MADSLPKILAGPIVRCAGEKGAWIWLATSEKVDVTAIAYDAKSTLKGGAAAEQVAIGTATSKAFGAALHITLVGMKPPAGTSLPAERLLAYNVELRPPSGPAYHLDDLDEFEGRFSIVYAPYSLPTFFIGAPGGRVNWLHGSCRKAHGDGDDATAGADALMRAHVDDLAQRPSVLFLTGDQIYADEVDETLARPVTALGARMLGFEETVQIRDGGPIVRVDSLFYGSRGEALSDTFTPNDADHLNKSLARNQLIGFGEYAAMHVLYWNEHAWPLDTGVEVETILTFRGRLAEVRRALANIPTYMMADDHDITDDWNRTKEWTKTAGLSPLGRSILANAIVAWWAFQGCGNDPEAAMPKFVSTAQKFFEGGGRGELEYELGALEARDFSFVAPTHPPVVVADMRTTRGPDKGALVDGKKPDPSAPPEIFGKLGLDAFVKLAKQACDTPGKLLVVVAPPPVIGYRQWEWTQEFVVEKGITSAAKVDLESWHADPAAYHRFLNAIAEEVQPGACLFLSGDLHFGHLTKAIVSSRGLPGKPSRHTAFTQFTSSALKNRHTRGERFGLRAANRLINDAEPEWTWKSTNPNDSRPTVRQVIPGTVPRLLDAYGVPDFMHRVYGIRQGPISDPLLMTYTNIGQLEMADDKPGTLARFTFVRATGAVILQHELHLDWRLGLSGARPQ